MTDMYGDRPELWEQTGEVVDRQLLSVDTPVLFLKEMAYLGLPYVVDNIFNQGIHTLIIRKPKACLRSRKTVRKNEISEWAFGFTAMNQLWERIFNADEPPVVIEGDALRNAPEYSLRKYCQAVGLDFQDSQCWCSSSEHR